MIITQYKVISDHKEDVLTGWINHHAKDGWRLVGPVQVTSGIGLHFVATMQREEDA